ncbi:MAG: cyclic nucleotide-binding domain-containing protein [Pirellulales bacterium]
MLSPARRGTLDDYLAADDIVSIPAVAEQEWDTIRRQAGWQLTRRFCTLRNLLVHGVRFSRDAMGFAWGGIYRTLFVSAIVTTSYRNEGHFRSGERIRGTSDFFVGTFVLPRSGADAREIVRLINLRHHVAGVCKPEEGDRVRVIDAYEAEFAYVATAFIESMRRGLELCGLPSGSRQGRAVAWPICVVLYQVAGLAGLTRMPRDLAAHERFRDAFDRHLRARPPSPRVRRMAQEIARRIVPVTASHADETVARHIARHIDPETREYLFPGGEIPADLEPQRIEWQRRQASESRTSGIEGRSRDRRAIWERPDVAALHRAYHDAVFVNTSDEVDDRLIGAILLYAIDSGATARPLERRSIDLAAGEPLIRQGESVGEMYVVLSATTPLIVLHAEEVAAEPRQVATLAAPAVLGEIGMWRGQPAVATVLSREPNRLEVIVIDRARFEELKQEPGFRAATAAEVQRRLALNSALVGTLLDDAAARTGDARLASIAQLFRFLTGDSHVALDAVIDLPAEATPAECVDALRRQVDDAIGAGLPPDLERYLCNVVATIG